MTRGGRPCGRCARDCATAGPTTSACTPTPRTGVTIGIRRLAIIDIEGGHQPLSNEDGSVWVAFNGEIYNHPQLREELRARGHRFATNCDTEVLVHLYEEYGDELVHALEGMFAFAIWDERRGRLLLARDRFGEKPLFVHESRTGDLLFASELTALLEVKARPARARPGGGRRILRASATCRGPGRSSAASASCHPGHLLTWEHDRGRCARAPLVVAAARCPAGSTSPSRCWPPRRRDCSPTRSARRMIADVPVGVFLSGGIDSTLVTSAAAEASSQRVKTFTVGYDVGAVDETVQARRVARAPRHRAPRGDPRPRPRWPSGRRRCWPSIDQPLADQALISLHALSEFARPLVTVALGGEGADELFGGYPRYRWIERAERLESALPRRPRAAGLPEPRASRWRGRGG